MFGDYQFQYPQAFWLLALLPFFVLLYLLYQSWKRKAIRRAGDLKLVTAMHPAYSPVRNHFKFILLLLAFSAGCIALANPRKPDKGSGEARSGIDIVIALDISNSMKATDIEPDRLSRAKQFCTKLVDQLKDDRLGLVLFAGNAYAQMPLTFDREAAKMYLNAANPSYIAAQGTSIGDAFQKSNLLFEEEGERFKSIILITDGETHDENALEMAEELADRGVMINSIGLGSPEGATLVDSSGNQKKDASGNVVVSKLNEEILQKIATETNGKYIRLQSSETAVSEVLNQYNGIEKKALGDSSLYQYSTFYHWFAIPMLILLATEIFFHDRKRIRK